MLFTIINIFIIIVFIFIVYRIKKSAYLVNKQIDTFHYGLKDATLPELSIQQEAPFIVNIGVHKLIIKPFNFARWAKFRIDFYNLLVLCQKNDLPFDFVAGDKYSKDNIAQVIALLSSIDVEGAIHNIIKKYIIENKESNPSKMKWNYFINNVSPENILNIFLTMKRFNVDSFKKKIVSILEEVSTWTPDTSKSSSLSTSDGQANNSNLPQYPEFSCWLEEEGSSIIVNHPKNQGETKILKYKKGKTELIDAK